MYLNFSKTRVQVLGKDKIVMVLGRFSDTLK